MNTNEEKVPVRVYKRRVQGMEDGVDRDLEITLSVYDGPVVRTQSMFLFNKIVIMDGLEEWGHGLTAEPIPDEMAETALNEIAKNIAKYKNK